VTRRVVAKDVDAASVSAAEVMTPNPTCVSLTDSGMDALTIMLENHFRHLPVTDESGSVVGLLDIAKCLNDAISKLELSQGKSSSAAEDAVKQVVGGAGAQNAALEALFANLMAQAFGNKKMPTLRSVLAGKPCTVVSPTTSVRDVGRLMAEHRKAALVVNNGKLVGIFGFKDMMTRVVAKCLPLDATPVQDVMTEQPESVLPEVTVLEALQTMHDHKFLTLPVCEEDGRVVGVVGVMDVIYGCGGAEGWRSLFDSIDVDDDMSAVSAASNATGKLAATNVPVPPGGKGLGALDEGDERQVSKLRPNRPIISSWDDSVLSVSQLLRSKRGTYGAARSFGWSTGELFHSYWNSIPLNIKQYLSYCTGAASLVIGADGTLSGIITDTDITSKKDCILRNSDDTRCSRIITQSLCPTLTFCSQLHSQSNLNFFTGRVVAKKMDAACTNVGQVMTENPTCVALNDPAIDALTTMVDNHFRHLPVVDECGSVVGLLDIAKCLNHAISRLEQSQCKTSSAAEDAVKQVVNQHGATGAQATALQALLGNLMSQAMGNATVPTLRTVLMNKPKPFVSPTTSVQDAAMVMAENRKAVIVVDDDGRLVGLFGFKDMMTRVVAKELPLETTLMRDVMTSSPEFVTPDVTVLHALQTVSLKSSQCPGVLSSLSLYTV
jgi:CBS domain-containing protein